MARFLFVGGDAGGDVGPRLTVMGELTARGHEVVHLSVPWLPSQLGNPQIIDDLGRRVAATGALPITHDEWVPDEPGTWSMPPMDQLAQFENVFVSSFYVPLGRAIARAVHREVSTWTYDAVGREMAAPIAAAACEAVGVPYAVLVNTIPFIRWWPGRPCPGTGRRLTNDTREDERLARTMDALVDALLLDVLNDFRHEVGIAPVDHVSECDDRASSVVVMTSPAFDHGSAGAPPNHHYVGACVPRGADDPTAAQQLLDHLDGDKPLVVMSPTTTGLATGQVPFVRASIEALASLPVSGIVTVGRSLDPARFDGASNLRIAAHVDHHALLSRAAAMITHCGHGTTMTAVHAGVPMVGLPDFADQRDIAARIADHGIGVVLEKPPSASAIGAAVEAVLTDPAFATASSRLAERVAADPGPRGAADELERVAGC